MQTLRRLLIIGCGDIALRAAPVLRKKFRLYGLTRSAEKHSQLRSLGITPIIGDLDSRASLLRIGGIADAILHTAPPPALTPNTGNFDTRTRNLLCALNQGAILPRRLVYISTSGVYGDCAGANIDETRRINPQTPRARRRVNAEHQLREWGKRLHVNIAILRAPGIYGADRLPLERLEKRTPVLLENEDVFTNHIHADDLAQACVAALFLALPQRAYNVGDATSVKMGAYFDLIADAFNLPRPPRISKAEAERVMTGLSFSFMRESRRLDNRRLREELRVVLKFPTVEALLKTIRDKP